MLLVKNFNEYFFLTLVQIYNRNSFFSDQQSIDDIAQLEQLPLIAEQLPHIIAFSIDQVEQVPEPEEIAEQLPHVNGKKL
jgi:hypothetical protein